MKPILSKIGVFDATKDHSFQFAAFTDIDLVAFIIFDKATGYNPSAPNQNDDGVYKFGTVAPTGSGLARHFTIPAGMFENRHDPYYIVIRCRLTGTNTFSEYSDRVLFYCHTEPTISLGNIEENQTVFIQYPSYSFDFTYNYILSEGEVVNRYEFYLYDKNKELIEQSNCYYHRDTLKSFQVSGLDNNASYYIRAKAESVGGYQLDTGFLHIMTNYPEAVDEATVTATNNKWDATIDLHTKYFLTRSTGVNELRFKRRRSGTSRWVTLCQKEIDFSRIIMKMDWANIHIRKTDGYPSESMNCVVSNYIDKSRIKTYSFNSSTKKFALIAYTSDKKFISATDYYSSYFTFMFSAEGMNWVSSDFQKDVAYYRVEVKADDENEELDTSDFNDFYMYSNDDGYVLMDFTDLYAKGRNTEYEYALSPVANGIELGYIKTNVKSSFDGAMLTDGNKIYRIMLEPQVTSLSKVRSAALVETIGSKYPYMFFGSEANYYTGSFSGVGIRFHHENDSFDIDDGNNFRDELTKWLTDTNAKVLKMADGRAWLIGVNGNVTVSCSDHIDKGVVEFDFAEIGDLCDETDMYNNGLSGYNPGGAL